MSQNLQEWVILSVPISIKEDWWGNYIDIEYSINNNPHTSDDETRPFVAMDDVRILEGNCQDISEY